MLKVNFQKAFWAGYEHHKDENQVTWLSSLGFGFTWALHVKETFLKRIGELAEVRRLQRQCHDFWNILFLAELNAREAGAWTEPHS